MSDSMEARNPVVAGNWKMNLGPRDATRFVDDLEFPDGGGDVELLLFPPSLSVHAVRHALDRRAAGVDTPEVGLGVQHIHWEPEGAFTGEISGEMAAEAGAGFTLIGHSERRLHFGESGDQTARRMAAAQRAGLTPVLCVGETLEERRGGTLESVLTQQLAAALSPRRVRGRIEEGARFLLAYEPVWAIGTGETATPEDAARAHGFLRGRLQEHLPRRAASVPILYGGSVKPGNATELLAASDVGGVLVGGASLDPGSFAAIAACAAGLR